MSLASNLPKYAVMAVLAGGVAILVLRMIGGGGSSLGTGRMDVKIPASFSAVAMEGKELFDENCAACHGDNASGTDQGPSLVQNIYRPGHHSNQAFVLAALTGVRAHHWPFGNMPKQPQVTQAQVLRITQYIRELQRANGVQ